MCVGPSYLALPSCRASPCSDVPSLAGYAKGGEVNGK